MDAVQLTRALVDIESTTGGEAAAGEYLYAHLAKLANRTGGVAERMALTAQRFNVLASWGTPVVTMSTHIDTVPPFLRRVRMTNLFGGADRATRKELSQRWWQLRSDCSRRKREISGFCLSW